jgi:hypothetical protein
MQDLTTLASIWGAITIVLLMLVAYRRTLTNQEKDWIPLNDYGNGSNAIETQTVLERKTKKLTVPIRALGTLSLVMFLVIVGLWVYHTISAQPTVFQ